MKNNNYYNAKNLKIVMKMESKLNKILHYIGYETDDNKIFKNSKVYDHVVQLLDDIDKLWNSIDHYSENMNDTYFNLIGIENTINANIKFFDIITYNDPASKSYPKIGRGYTQEEFYPKKDNNNSPQNKEKNKNENGNQNSYYIRKTRLRGKN